MRRSCRHRPNRKLTNSTSGIRFAQGLKPVRGSEALNTIPCVVNVTGLVLSELPFLQAGHQTVVEKKPAKDAMLGTLPTIGIPII